MDLGLYGFFGGAAPGIAYLLLTMVRVRQTMSAARNIAQRQGEFLDFDSSENQSYDFLLSPQNFIKPTDGPGVRDGKKHLLSIRDWMWRRYWIGLILVIVGVPVGLFLATCAEYLLGRPW